MKIHIHFYFCLIISQSSSNWSGIQKKACISNCTSWNNERWSLSHLHNFERLFEICSFDIRNADFVIIWIIYKFTLHPNPPPLHPFQFYINDTSRFATVSELVQHHEKVADGLACPLLYGVSKRDQSGNRGGGALDSDYDAWEIDRTDIIMKHKLGESASPVRVI